MTINSEFLKQALSELQFFRLEANFAKFIQAGRDMARNALEGRGTPRFALDCSYLRRGNGETAQDSRALIIDIGGSKTKVALLHKNTWQILLYRENGSFRPQATGASPLSDYVNEIAHAIVAELKFHHINPKETQSVGVIWSNALRAQPIQANESDTRGVTGTVCGMDGVDSGSYRKGEWFIEGLSNGSPLGDVFISALSQHGISPKVFIIGNDTVFTLKALPGADAGMVASTGANATLIDTEQYICNAEIGGLFELDDRFLSSIDRAEAQGSSTKLEDLIAGKWLPKLFQRYVVAIGQKGDASCSRFIPIIKEFEQKDEIAFDDQALTALLRSGLPIRKVPDSLFGPAGADSDAAVTLRFIAEQVVRRAGMAAAGMAYLSVCTLAPQEAYRISLDSSQARLLPGYFESMHTTLISLLAPAKVDLLLLSPHEIESMSSTGKLRGQITVPMRGVCFALQELL